jgi:hypothetical protein
MVIGLKLENEDCALFSSSLPVGVGVEQKGSYQSGRTGIPLSSEYTSRHSNLLKAAESCIAKSARHES